MALVIKVSKEEAEKIRRKMVRENLLDDRWKIVEEGDYLILPVKKPLPGSFEHPLPPRWERKTPYERVKDILPDVPIPHHWERFGSVLILPPFHGYEEFGEEVGEAFSRVLGVKTVLVYFGTRGEFREPKVVKIYGEDTVTTHVENGIRFRFDAAKIMFSSGNVDERMRMGKIDARGEIVVDLFAGIGYFTLPVAIRAGASKVYACEKNPISFSYLVENIKINGAHNVIPLLGDNRDVAPERIAHRVIMGYVGTERFLDLGFKVLREEGGIVHYHDTFTTEEKGWKPEKVVKEYGEKNGFHVEILGKRIVKSYAPHIWHIVVDARAIPKN